MHRVVKSHDTDNDTTPPDAIADKNTGNGRKEDLTMYIAKMLECLIESGERGGKFCLHFLTGFRLEPVKSPNTSQETS